MKLLKIFLYVCGGWFLRQMNKVLKTQNFIKMRQIDDSTAFNLAVKAKTLSIAFFTATWCGPCRTMYGPVERLAAEHTGIDIFKVDVDVSPNIAQTYDITSMPTFVLFKNSTEIDRLKGANLNGLKSKIDMYLHTPAPANENVESNNYRVNQTMEDPYEKRDYSKNTSFGILNNIERSDQNGTEMLESSQGAFNPQETGPPKSEKYYSQNPNEKYSKLITDSYYTQHIKSQVPSPRPNRNDNISNQRYQQNYTSEQQYQFDYSQPQRNVTYSQNHQNTYPRQQNDFMYPSSQNNRDEHVYSFQNNINQNNTYDRYNSQIETRHSPQNSPLNYTQNTALNSNFFSKSGGVSDNVNDSQSQKPKLVPLRPVQTSPKINVDIRNTPIPHDKV